MDKRNIRRLFLFNSINIITLISMIVCIIIMSLIFIYSASDFNYDEYVIDQNKYINEYYKDTFFAMNLLNVFIVCILIITGELSNKFTIDCMLIGNNKKNKIILNKIISYIIIVTILLTIEYEILYLVLSIRYPFNKLDFNCLLLFVSNLVFIIYVINISLLLHMVINNPLPIIIIPFLFLFSSIINDTNKIISNLVFIHISEKGLDIGLFFGIIMMVIIGFVSMIIYRKKEIKIN